MALQVDEQITPELLSRLAQLEGVLNARFVHLNDRELSVEVNYAREL